MKKIDYPNIEHIIINDGSTDNVESLILEYIREVPYPVKYKKQENAGKHIALNSAWDIVEGDFCIQLDADDELLPHSISFLVEQYYCIPKDIRDDYWCVLGRCVTQCNEFVGDTIPANINNNDWRVAGRIAAECKGEKIGLQRFKGYLSNYRFPPIIGLSHIPECIVWRQLNSKYGTWYTNEVCRVYYVNEGGNLCSKPTTRKQFAATAYGIKDEIIQNKNWNVRKIKQCIKYVIAYCLSWEKYRIHNPFIKDIQFLDRVIMIILYPGIWLASVPYRIIKSIK